MTIPTAYVYNIVTVQNNYDGDTCNLIIDLGFSTLRRINVRLIGLDTPEASGSTKEIGKLVRDIVTNKLQTAIVLESKELDKYGRSLGVIWLKDGTSLNQFLIDNGLALPYDGSSRVGTWTSAKLMTAKNNALSILNQS